MVAIGQPETGVKDVRYDQSDGSSTCCRSHVVLRASIQYAKRLRSFT